VRLESLGSAVQRYLLLNLRERSAQVRNDLEGDRRDILKILSR